MVSGAEANRAVAQYADTVRRICLVQLKNQADTEDIFQTVFLRYLLHAPAFETPEHEKAWIIRVTLNACKDLRRALFRRRTVPLEEAVQLPATATRDRQVLEAVLSLPEKYRQVVYLHYYEGYTAAEMGQLLGKNVNTVYTLLNRARGLLREELGGDEIDG